MWFMQGFKLAWFIGISIPLIVFSLLIYLACSAQLAVLVFLLFSQRHFSIFGCAAANKLRYFLNLRVLSYRQTVPLR